MRLALLYKLLAFVHFITLSQHSHVQEAKRQIRAELNGIWRQGGGGGGGSGGSHGRGPWPSSASSTSTAHSRSHPPHRYYHHHHHHHHHNQRPRHHHSHQPPHHHPYQQSVVRAHRLNGGIGGGGGGSVAHWSGRRHSMERHQHHFTEWTAWSMCDEWDCVQRRERYCRHKRKCGYTKHVEERKCWGVCAHHHHHHHAPQHHSHPQQQHQQQSHQQTAPASTQQHNNNSPQAIIITTGGGVIQPTQPAITTSAPPPPPPPLPPSPSPASSRPPPITIITAATTESPWLLDNDIELVHGNANAGESGDEGGVVVGGGGDSDELHVVDADEYVPHAPPPNAIRIPVLEESFIEYGDADDDIDHQLHQHNHRKPHKHSHHNHHHDHHRSGEEVSDWDDAFAEFDGDGDGDGYDFYAVRARRSQQQRRGHRRYRRKQIDRQQLLIDASEYRDLAAEVHDDDERQRSGEWARHVLPVRLRSGHDEPRRGRGRGARKLNDNALRERDLEAATSAPLDDGIDGDTLQYEDFDFGREYDGRPPPAAADRRADSSQYSESYEDLDYTDAVVAASGGRNVTLQPSRERATYTELLPRHRRIYSKWSRWRKCSDKCTTRRFKKCRVREQCGREVLREIAYCYTEGSFCQQWLQAQVQKIPAPAAVSMTSRRISGGGGGGNSINSLSGGRSSDNNAIADTQHDYIMNGKGYRGPEYTPQKLHCGIANVRNSRRSNVYNMLKIIGGKASRKGEWPWQVAIFNRFKEAFCGGTLVAPQWVLTAAHCVRKVLYVRIGEHNLDYEDGTEMQLRVLKSFKHPNFDKKTVDSDVALLKLPKAVNASTWVGFSCLPHPYQVLPKNMDCTVIGWGKRRNRDVAGTSVLHQAEVPIIPMDNCRSVYHDYTITKNMFCAGHKRGRIDTCAGDSGGPLLCRDTTRPNHPWTIFGITSFGDGCAKRNKFGIYAKVPNYVDWVWSVINCNGNCKLHRGALTNN